VLLWYYDRIMTLWESLPDREGLHVLDASAGAGYSTRRLLAMGFKVTVTNYQQERDERIPPEADFVGDVDLNKPLPFDDETFDGAHLQEVIEHIENPAHVVREFARVLKPGGVFVLSTPNVLNALARVRFALTGFLEGLKRPVSYAKPPGEADNIYMTNLPQLHYLLAHSGMSIEKMVLSPYNLRSVFLAIVLYPLFWLATMIVTLRVRRKDLLMKNERLATPDETLDELLVKQRRVQRRLRKLLLSKEVLLGRNLMIRARKTGADPFDA